MATSYNPYYSGGWQSGEEGNTPITPDALNHMDTGIAGAFDYTTQSTAKYLGDVNLTNTETATAVDLSPYNVLVCVYYRRWTRFPIGTIIIPLWRVRSYHGQTNNFDTWTILDPLDSTKYATITYVSDSSVLLSTNDQGNKYIVLIGLA